MFDQPSGGDVFLELISNEFTIIQVLNDPADTVETVVGILLEVAVAAQLGEGNLCKTREELLSFGVSLEHTVNNKKFTVIFVN